MSYEYPQIDESAIVPKYFVVKQTIINWLRMGSIKPCEKLPTENELVVHFSVSRITIRRALDELETEGYINKVQGKGSFAANRFEQDYSYSQSKISGQGYKKQIEFFGFEHERRFLSIKRIFCPTYEAEVFGISENEWVYMIERVHCADGKPAIYVSSILHPNKTSGIESYNLIGESMLTIFMQVFGFKTQSIRRRVKTVLADNDIALAMGVEEGFPLLQLSYQTIIVNEVNPVPIESAYAYYRTDLLDYIPDVLDNNPHHNHHEA